MHRYAVAAGVELVRFAHGCGLTRGESIAIDGTNFVLRHALTPWYETQRAVTKSGVLISYNLATVHHAILAASIPRFAYRLRL